MKEPPNRKDMVVLTADKNAQFSLKGILARHQSLGFRPLSADYVIHPRRDPGVFHDPTSPLTLYAQSHAYALVLMDREGSGREHLSATTIQNQLEQQLALRGWARRSAAIVIDPELDIWVWSDSPHVDSELGWAGCSPTLRDWLAQQGHLMPGNVKPPRPKEALEKALFASKRPRSSSLYLSLATKVGLSNCTDPAFLRLRSVLRQWFPS